jgi:hypothetical protein
LISSHASASPCACTHLHMTHGHEFLTRKIPFSSTELAIKVPVVAIDKDLWSPDERYKRSPCPGRETSRHGSWKLNER